MKIVFSFFFFIITALLISCSNDSTKESHLPLEEQSNSDITIRTDQFKLLDSSQKVAETSVPFSQVKAFFPDDNFKHSQPVQDSEFSYIKLNEQQDTILGKIILENKTKEPMNIQNFFIQGNHTAPVKTKSSKNWGNFIAYNVEPNSSVEIDIAIKWNPKGMNELMFFPLEAIDSINLYDGTNLHLIRYFVMDQDFTADEQAFKNQQLNIENVDEIRNFFPTPNWIGENQTKIDYTTKNEQLFSTTPIHQLKLEAVPYQTKIDVLLMDDTGKTSPIAQNVPVEKNQETFIPLNADLLTELQQSNRKYYFFIFNNREEELLFDMEAVHSNLKPFPTTYQSVIEFHKVNLQSTEDEENPY